MGGGVAIAGACEMSLVNFPWKVVSGGGIEAGRGEGDSEDLPLETGEFCH